MTELLRLLMELIQPLWPLRIVWTYERGLYYFCGRFQGEVGPGLKLVFPYLCDVKYVRIVPEICTTPLQTITLRDGRTLTYSASLTVIVTSADKAYNKVGHYAETVVELAGRVVSERLAEADPDRFDPTRKKRANLIEEIREAINEAASEYGVQVTALGLNNFALGVRTVRLLLDKSVMAEGNHVN